MVFFIESGNLSEILRNAVIDFLIRICYDEIKRQVHGMREILLLEDDGALGRASDCIWCVRSPRGRAAM